MEVSVTRSYRGKKDAKGNIVSSYNYSPVPSTIKKQEEATTGQEYVNPLRTELVQFVLCINFVDLVTLEYTIPDDLIISDQTYENGAVEFFIDSNEYVLNDLLIQFTKLSIIPSAVGMVLIVGSMKSSFVQLFSQYIEVKAVGTCGIVNFSNTYSPSVENYDTLFRLTFGDYPHILLLVDDGNGNEIEVEQVPKRYKTNGVLTRIAWDEYPLPSECSGKIIITK